MLRIVTSTMSLSTRGSRVQFAVAVTLTSIVPLLALAYLSLNRMSVQEAAGAKYALYSFLGLLVLFGYVLLLRYPVTIRRLRSYLEKMVQGELPDRIDLLKTENDINAVEDSLNLILARLKERIKVVETEKSRLEMELFQSRQLETVGTLAAGIAHEINTPIQFIGNNIHFLQKACNTLWETIDRTQEAGAGTPSVPLTPQEQEHLAFLRREMPEAIRQSQEGAERIAAIVAAMKSFAHRGADRTKTIADLNQAVTDTIVVSQNVWKHVAEVRADLAPDLPPVLCFPGEIKQALLNLVTNAVQAIAERGRLTPEPAGRIVIRSRLDGNHVVLAVADNGAGIPPAARDRVFEPFFTTKELGRGYGLTLAYASVVNRHGGRLTFETREDAGTTFQIALPIGTTQDSAAHNGAPV